MTDICIRMSEKEVEKLDELIRQGYFRSRSDALRFCTREYLIRRELQ